MQSILITMNISRSLTSNETESQFLDEVGVHSLLALTVAFLSPIQVHNHELWNSYVVIISMSMITFGVDDNQRVSCELGNVYVMLCHSL